MRKVNRRRQKEKPRTRFATREEYERLLAACHQSVHVNIIKVVVATGMRHGELLDFQKSWIKWNRMEIHIPSDVTKGEKARIVPITGALEQVLREQCESTQKAHVFCYLDLRLKSHVPFASFKNFFRAARSRAGLEDLRFHDLRHTFGSWWSQADSNLLSLKDVMGHVSVKTTERYSHINTGTLHRVREEVERHTEGTVTRFLKHTPRRRS